MFLRTVIFTICLQSVHSLYWSDQSKQFECPEGESFSYIDNSNPDNWEIRCNKRSPTEIHAQTSWWSVAYFNWPIISTTTCSGMGIVTGIKAVHAQWSTNGARYKRYQLICSNVRAYHQHKCFWTRPSHSFQRLNKLQISKRRYLTGLYMKQGRNVGELLYSARLCSLKKRKECFDPSWPYHMYLC